MLIASCSRALRACARSLCVALVAAGLAAIALPAAAVQVTVSGTTYDISVLINTTYALNTVLLESQPWWGDAGLAADIISTYLANGGDTAVDFGVGIVDFATGPSGPGTIWVSYPQPPATVGTISNAHEFVSNYATATIITAVPEIDGNALAKALFILFALGAWLHTRRRRLA